MKRAVPPDYDPVYPYGEKRINLMPPFFHDNGFKEEPDGVLSLKLGAGLNFNADGALTSTGAAGGQVQPPLEMYRDTLRLNVGPGLQTQNQALTIKSDEESVETENNTLQVKVGLGLQKSSQGLEVKIGDGMMYDVNKGIRPSLQPPLATNFGSIALKYDPSMHTVPAIGLGVKTKNPLYVDTDPNFITNGVGLNIAPGFTINANGALDLLLQDPLSLQPQGLTLNIGAGLIISQGEVRPVMAPPIIAKLGSITLDYDGNSLGLTPINQKLSVRTVAPLTVGPQGIQLKIGAGLRVDGDLVRTVVAPPLVHEFGSIALKAGRGLTTGTPIELNIAAPFSFSPTNAALQLDLDPNLIIKNNKLTVKLPTLWTTIPSYANCKFTIGNTFYNTGKLTVALTRVGGLVMGYMNFQGTTPLLYFSSVDWRDLDFKFNFDEKGEYRRGNISAPFGIQNGSTVDTASSVNLLQFMPAASLYNNTLMVVSCNYGGSSANFGHIGITLNRRDPAYPLGYGLYFRMLDPPPTTSTLPALITGVTFSYIGEPSF